MREGISLSSPQNVRAQHPDLQHRAGEGKMTETALQIIQIDQSLWSEVAKEPREIQSKIGEFEERKVAKDILGKIEIRAPQVAGCTISRCTPSVA
jgi:hypothetical protein